MENRGLLFIPDISGYTRFINNTEIEHSRYIIQELLEVLVNSNSIDLKVSEIEGDAILFYRFGDLPTVDEMYKQVEKMFCNFHKYIKQYEERRICDCKACEQAKELTLKVITHQGEFSTYTVKEFNKLIGKDVIKAHQLLKNDIPLHEYWLVTDDIYHQENKTNLPEWMEWKEGKKQDDTNEIGFHYSLLTPLRNNISPEPADRFGIKGSSKMVISARKEFDVDIDKMFKTVADLSLRPQWMEGVKAIENITTKIPQVGTAHNCIINGKVNLSITSGFNKDEKTIILEETDNKRLGTFQMVLEKKDDHTTLLSCNLIMKNNPLVLVVFNLFMKKNMKKAFGRSVENLENYFKQQKKAA